MLLKNFQFLTKKNISNEQDLIQKSSIANDTDPATNQNSKDFKFNIATALAAKNNSSKNKSPDNLPFHFPRTLKTEEEKIKKFRNLYRAKTGRKSKDRIGKQKSSKLDHEFKLEDELKLGDIRNIIKGRKLINSKEQKLQFKGEFKISKSGQVLQLREFMFDLPKELERDLEDKPFRFVLDKANSSELTGSTDRHLNDNLNDLKLESLSDNLTHERVSSTSVLDKH